MGFEMILNIFVEHPVAGIVVLLMGGGILFGIFGGFTGIAFFTENWLLLIGLGFFVLFLWIVVEIIQS